MARGFEIRINQAKIAKALLDSGDLDRDNCNCGLEYDHDESQELQEIIDLTLDVIEVFGEAGLRALAHRAENRADELGIKIRARQATGESEKAMGTAQLSEYDQIALLSAVGRIGGDMDAYDMAASLLRRGLYTAAEFYKLTTPQLKHLLS
jgi:hypothetical protein